MKASINGPNRRKNRVGNKTIASDLNSHSDGNTKTNAHNTTHTTDNNSSSSSSSSSSPPTTTGIQFKVKSLEKYLADRDGSNRNVTSNNNSSNSSNSSGTFLNKESIGDACLFTVPSESESENEYCSASSGKKLLKQHFQMSHLDSQTNVNNINKSDHDNIKKNNPILIHFHEIPIFILRAIPIYTHDPIHTSTGTSTSTSTSMTNSNDCNIIYLSQVHCHNHKICEDTIYTIRCCSRIINDNVNVNVNTNGNDSTLPPTPSFVSNYDNLSAVGIEVFLRYDNDTASSNYNSIKDDNSHNDDDDDDDDYENDGNDGNDGNDDDSKSLVKTETFNANDIAKLLINHCLYSVLTINECLVIEIQNKELVCRVSKLCIDTKSMLEENGTEDQNENCEKSPKSQKELSAAEASLDDPYRGRIMINTEFYIQTSNHDAVRIDGGKVLPEGKLPEDIIHITTSDDEWFPVRRLLLAPCIHLTKYVQHGKGIYKKDHPLQEKKEEEKANLKSNRSPDAPETGIHCKVDIDCCTFDRVLVFIMSQIYPEEYKFALDLSELNAMSHAAEELGLLSLSDLCKSQSSSFASRVRKDKYITFNEIQKRNEHDELLIIIDGMVLDITRWIDEHPGGPSIIPSQALNIDCTCFFEMYHISKASFLYLKSFYIGELHPATELKNSEIEPSEGFLQSLRSYTDQWRVTVEEKVGQDIHKSL